MLCQTTVNVCYVGSLPIKPVELYIHQPSTTFGAFRELQTWCVLVNQQAQVQKLRDSSKHACESSKVVYGSPHLFRYENHVFPMLRWCPNQLDHNRVLWQPHWLQDGPKVKTSRVTMPWDITIAVWCFEMGVPILCKDQLCCCTPLLDIRAAASDVRLYLLTLMRILSTQIIILKKYFCIEAKCCGHAVFFGLHEGITNVLCSVRCINSFTTWTFWIISYRTGQKQLMLHSKNSVHCWRIVHQMQTQA